MTPEQQRIAIAEACGWVEDTRQNSVWYHPTKKGLRKLPDYLSDLNAMYEAEKVLTLDQYQKYVTILHEITSASIQSLTIRQWRAIISATSTHRAEAFLRALNLWNDRK